MNTDRHISKCLDICSTFWYNCLLDSLISRSSKTDKIISGIWSFIQFDRVDLLDQKNHLPTNLGTILLTCRSRKNSFFLKSELTNSLLVSNLKSFHGWQDSPFNSEFIHWTNTHRRVYRAPDNHTGAGTQPGRTHMVPPGETDKKQPFPWFSYSCDEGHAGRAPKWVSWTSDLVEVREGFLEAVMLESWGGKDRKVI